MTLRPAALVLAMAALASGCVVAPGHHETRETRYEHREWHGDESYEGYAYVRIVYFNGVPWYVDEDLRARPVPRHLHTRFRDTAWVRSMPPRFHDHDEVRDGYRVSRIIYINNVPHHVDEGRHVRPLPSRLRSRFAYQTVARPAVVRSHDAPRGPARVQERDDADRGRPFVTREARGRDDEGRNDFRHSSRDRRDERYDDRRGEPVYARERQPLFVREVGNDDRRGERVERVREEHRQGEGGGRREARVEESPRGMRPQPTPQVRYDDDGRGRRDDDYRGQREAKRDARGTRERESVRDREERAEAAPEKQRKGSRRDDDVDDERRGGPKWSRGN